MKNYKVFGRRILTKKILEKKSLLENEEIFNNRVTVLDVGDEVEKDFEVGDELIIMPDSGYEFEDELYVTENQILKWKKNTPK